MLQSQTFTLNLKKGKTKVYFCNFINLIKRDLQYFILMEIYFQINLWLMEHLTPPCVYQPPHHPVLFCAYIISSVNQSSGVGKIKKISQLSWLDDLCLVRQKYDIL